MSECAATTFEIHPAEMVRVWQLIGEKTKLDQTDANISAIACEIFGKGRGHMAEEALRVIQRHVLDECTMDEAHHAIGLCTALAGAPGLRCVGQAVCAGMHSAEPCRPPFPLLYRVYILICYVVPYMHEQTVHVDPRDSCTRRVVALISMSMCCQLVRM